MGMTNTVRELKKDMGDMMDKCKAMLGKEMLDADSVEPEVIELTRKLFKVCDLSMTLMEQQAETIEKMDEKLDKLLEKNS